MTKLFGFFIAVASLLSINLNGQSLQRNDLVIDEIFSNPSPAVSLPNAEFIEIKNTSGKSLNLQGCRLITSTAKSGLFPSYVLAADSFLIICSTTSLTVYSSYGRALGVTSFPTLNNSGTTLSVFAKEGATIHSVSYNKIWYQNDVKSKGGWSLEMIDTKNPCDGSHNWKASTDLRGGTPGIKNSVDAKNPDNTSPTLVKAFAVDSLHLLLTFSEPVDSMKAANPANYVISDAIRAPLTAVTLAPSFTTVQLSLSVPLRRKQVYTIAANNITDCSGNVIDPAKTTRVGLSDISDSMDIIVNEILFNPKPGSVDYVEIYNRSFKVFNLKDVYIANRSTATSSLANLQQVTTENTLFFPRDFLVISENGAAVKQDYVAKNPDNFIDVSLPSFPDDRGVAVILNAQGHVIDELEYSEKWHFSLIDNKEGISLERIDYNKPTQNKDNWTSAASSAGFGTPSYQNSQFRNDLTVAADVTVTPKVFSPDNDGFDDFTFVNIKMSDPGYVANITIFDATGRPIKVLTKNATLALTGSFKWDGLDDKLRKVPVGVYVIYTEVFNMNGKKRSFKNTVAVATRL